MISERNVFFSKILLFGEYSIIQGSKALAIPYSLFEAKLEFPGQITNSDKARQSNQELRDFYTYLKDMVIENDSLKIDFASFKFDLDRGLYFHSTIPEGHGVGSSGALCAAIFERYGQSTSNNANELKGVFSLMESHFHGSSSGIDPIISYLNNPVLFSGGGTLDTVVIPKYREGKGAIFLLDTKRPRRTEPLVNLFLEKCKNQDFREFCRNELFDVTHKCIENFMEGQIKSLNENFKKLSRIQYENFLPMIPKLYHPLWEAGLERGDYSLKLCGAGGGGFLLGITHDFAKFQKRHSDLDLRAVFHF